MKKIISTTKAPAAVGPYSQAVQAGNFLYISGQIPLNPETGQLYEGDIEFLTERVMENLKAILNAADYSMSDVVKVNIYAKNMGDFPKINGVYAKYFEKDPPARAFVEVSNLPKGVSIEIEMIAWKE